MAIKLNEITVACIKFKTTLPNMVIRCRSGAPEISKMELFVIIAYNGSR